MKRIFAIALALTLGLAAMAQEADPVVASIIKEGLENNQTMDHLDVLSNRIGGRLLGSAAYQDAENWCEYKLRQWGWEVHREEVGELPVGFNRGPWFGRMIGGNGMNLHFVTPSYTSGTKGVQRGRVVKEPRTTAEFERMKATIKGAWVLIDGDADGWPIDWSDVGEKARAKDVAYNDSISRLGRDVQAPKMKSTPALFYRQMVEAGALGFIQSSRLPLTCLYDRKNLMSMDFEHLPSVPDIKLDENQYKVISKMVEDREYFELEFDIRNHFRLGPIKYHNIIAVLRGTEFPDEYVMAGGHLDAYDGATGGVDCGVGSTVALEVARLLSHAGAKPKRSIVLCLWAGEEFGLWGSKFWVENHMESLPGISNYFNRDGGPTMSMGITVPEAMYEDFKAVCEPLSEIYGFYVKKREGAPRPRPTSAGGSDHAYFAMNGVPTINFDQGDPTGYNFSYREIWHTERDTYDKSIPEYQNATSVITAVTVYGLANLDHILSRTGLYSN